MSVKIVNDSNFNSFKEEKKIALIDFFADWCGPCRMVAPVVHEIAEEHPEYAVGKINVDDAPELAREFGVFSIPTLVVLKDGDEADRAVGYRSKDAILAMLESVGG